MTPYDVSGRRALLRLTRISLLLLGLTAFVQTAEAQSGKPVAASKFAYGAGEQFTRKGLEHFYSLEFDLAQEQFERAAKARPDDPNAVNHLLKTILFREMYRTGALDTTLYAQKSFLEAKRVEPNQDVREQVLTLVDRAGDLENALLKQDPKDVDALFARGVTRGLKSSYTALVERAFVGGLKSALGSRNDHERVLELDPQRIDAKVAIGMHNYIIGSLPLPVKIMVGVVGIRGDKKKGLAMLAEVWKANAESSVDARIALALFLRREARYADAIEVVQSLVKDYPRNFLFALENANLLKDAGRGPEAVAAYTKLVDSARHGRLSGTRLELAYYGLAESHRGQRSFDLAAQFYEAVRDGKDVSPEILQRSRLGAGEMYDLLERRDLALRSYQAVIALDADTAHAEAARKYLRTPYRQTRRG